MNNYNSLDLSEIKKEIAGYSAIFESSRYILDETVDYNPLIIKRNILETNEALKLLIDDKYLSFDGILNPKEILDKAGKNITLNGNELYQILVLLNHSERIKKFFNNVEDDISLKDYSSSLMLNKNIVNEIEKAIDTAGNIKDDASIALKEITNKLIKNENDLMEKANRFIRTNTSSLQETSIYTRNNRVTFLIKNVDKNKFGGYSYGPSSSGSAQYVEPKLFIELNNEKERLENQRLEEIERIFSRLTYLVSTFSDELTNNFETMVKLNVIFSKANYGFKRNGKLASIGEYLDLKYICHPLINSNSVVSNNYSLKEPYKGIVISGSNTGGKTVSLKLIGLSIILTYLGIPLLCEKAIIPLFDNVYVDIDDNQSIASSLSTFSAHISNINFILMNANEKSLILIDELISGTDPKEAQAISISILERILNIGSSFVITTHFDDIKNFAYDNPNILLSSVGFDLKNLKPTYKYFENSVGASNALEIASRYFSDECIVNRAKEILLEHKSSHEILMDKLANEVAYNDSLKNELENKEKELNDIKDDYLKKINDFENSKIKIKEDYLNELNIYIENKKEEIDNYISDFKVNNKENVKNIKKQLDKTIEKTIEKKVEKIEVGDIVTVNNNEVHSEVLEINNDNVIINMNGIKVKTKIKNLTKINVSKPIIKKYVEKQRSTKNVSHELNLVGQRVEDGLIMLESYLDDAYSCNYSSVRIIHGIGTGALRKAIHEKLKKIKYVSTFKLADYNEGGSAITIVEFKK